MQQEFFDNCKEAFGFDAAWWLLPTLPELRVNYFERVWPKKEIKKMYKSEQFEKDTDDSDPDKKQFSVTQKKAQVEKKIFWVMFVCSVLGWFFVVQDLLVGNMYNAEG